MKIGITRLQTTILFAILFVVVGWVAPTAYATYAPSDNFITVHHFDAQNTTTSSNSHLVCFNRTVHSSGTGKVYTELWLLDNNSNKVIQVQSNHQTKYFPAGDKIVLTDSKLPNDTEPGKYRYLSVIKLTLANGNVQREFTFKSDPFTTSKNSTAIDQDNFTC